jgi:pimeloyl-ACP methyl ester carboxylesterase
MASATMRTTSRISPLSASRVVALPNSGHFPHLAHPAAFAKLLADTANW